MLAKPQHILLPAAAAGTRAAGCQGWENPAGDQLDLPPTAQARDEVLRGLRLLFGSRKSPGKSETWKGRAWASRLGSS